MSINLTSNNHMAEKNLLLTLEEKYPLPSYCNSPFQVNVLSLHLDFNSLENIFLHIILYVQSYVFKAHILRLLQFFLGRDFLSSKLHAFCESYPMSQRLNSLYIHHVKCVKLEIKFYLKKQFHPEFKGNIKYPKKMSQHTAFKYLNIILVCYYFSQREIQNTEIKYYPGFGNSV